MEVFVHRQPKGYIISEREAVQEIGELLSNYGPLGPNDEVTVEITAPWCFVRDLLSNLKFHDNWLSPERERSAPPNAGS